MSTTKTRTPTPASERFRAWLAGDARSYDAIADIIGTNKSSLSQWANGWNRPTIQRAARIEALTDGRVSVADWLTADEVAQVRAVRMLA